MSPIIVGGRTLFGSLSSQPTGITTAVGSEYYDTTDGEKRVYASTGWQNVSTASAAPAISTMADLTSQASWTVWLLVVAIIVGLQRLKLLWFEG